MNSDKSKILFVISNPSIGGIETFILSLLPYFKELGPLKNYLVSDKNDLCDIIKQDGFSKTRVIQRSQLGFKVDLLNIWNNSPMKKPAIEKGLSYTELSGKNRMISIKNIAEIIRLVKRNDYKVVFGFGLRVTMILRVIRFFYGRRLLITGLRGIDKWRRWYHVYMDRLTRGLSDYYVANSDAVAKEFISRENYSRDKMVVIKNGIDINEYDPVIKKSVTDRAFNLPAGKIIISTIANLRYEKGYDFYIKVIRLYLRKFDDVIFVWVGEGPLKEYLQEELQKAGALGKVIMLGKIDNVAELLASSDVFVLPSREEGMSRALMEAMSMSLPCVASNVGGAEELIENGKSGFIAEFEDVDTFGQSIIKLIEDEHLRKNMGLEARKTIEKKFNMQMIADQYACFFKDIISGEKDKDAIRKTLKHMAT